eukprot:403354122
MKIVQFDMEDEEQQYDLLNEVYIIKHLDSKYLCKSVDCFVNTNDEFCMVFPFAKNGDLLSYIEKNMPGEDIPEETLKEWIAQIALGLLELHSSNIMHRDIKPSNILVLDDGSLQIFDFGMAAKSGERPKRKRSFAGTYDYMAPEQALQKYDNQLDIFSLGISLVQIANKQHSRHLPFSDKFETFAPNYSFQFNDLVWKMLNGIPKVRPNAFQIVTLDYLSQTKPIIDYFNDKGSVDYAYGMINQCLKVISFHIGKHQRDNHSYIYMHELETLIKQIDQLKFKLNNYQFHAKAYWDELCPEYDKKLIDKYQIDFNCPNQTGFYGQDYPNYLTDGTVYRRFLNDQYRDKPLVWTVKDAQDTSEIYQDICEQDGRDFQTKITQVDKVITQQVIIDSHKFNREEKRHLWLQDSQEYLKNELENVKILNTGMKDELHKKCLDIIILSVLQNDARKEIAKNVVNQLHMNVEDIHWCCLVGQYQVSYNLYIDIKYFMDIEYLGYKVIVFVENFTVQKMMDLEKVRQLAAKRKALEDQIIFQQVFSLEIKDKQEIINQ